MCACVHVCVLKNAYTCTCMYKCEHDCLCLHIYVCAYVTCVHIYVNVSMCVSLCLCVHVCAHALMCACDTHVCKCVSMCVHCDTVIPNSNFHSDSALPCFSFCLSTSLHFVLIPFNLRGSLCQPELITCTVSYFSSCL